MNCLAFLLRVDVSTEHETGERLADLIRDLYGLGPQLLSLFRKFAERVDLLMGSPWAFLSAAVIIVIWAASSPAFGFAEQWQLVINSITTIVCS